MTSNHHGCSQRGLDLQPLLRQGFRGFCPRLRKTRSHARKREQVLARTRQELPHAVEVQVEEVEDRGSVIAVRALLWVETESQKGIVIGSGGRMIKAIGTAAVLVDDAPVVQVSFRTWVMP